MDDRGGKSAAPQRGCAAFRDRLYRARWRMVAITCLLGALGATIVAPPRPWFIWNVTQSAPVGLYAIWDDPDLDLGDMVAAHVPRPWRGLAAGRRYLPTNVPLIKRIAAAPGDDVCAIGLDILVNGRRAARRHKRDGAGRPMPAWSGCVRLQRGQYLLLMDDRESFDGRYFGPTVKDDIIGRVHLLWAR